MLLLWLFTQHELLTLDSFLPTSDTICIEFYFLLMYSWVFYHLLFLGFSVSPMFNLQYCGQSSCCLECFIKLFGKELVKECFEIFSRNEKSSILFSIADLLEAFQATLLVCLFAVLIYNHIVVQCYFPCVPTCFLFLFLLELY